MLFLILILNSYNLIGNRWYYSLIENYTAELISYFLNSSFLNSLSSNFILLQLFLFVEFNKNYKFFLE